MADRDKIDTMNDYEPEENNVEIIYFKFIFDVWFEMCGM